MSQGLQGTRRAQVARPLTTRRKEPSLANEKRAPPLRYKRRKGTAACRSCGLRVQYIHQVPNLRSSSCYALYYEYYYKYYLIN